MNKNKKILAILLISAFAFILFTQILQSEPEEELDNIHQSMNKLNQIFEKDAKVKPEK